MSSDGESIGLFDDPLCTCWCQCDHPVIFPDILCEDCQREVHRGSPGRS